jgi:hypothetical protein
VSNTWNLKGDNGLLALVIKLELPSKNQDGTQVQRSEMIDSIKAHYKKTQFELEKNFHNYLCFQAPKQAIDRKRKRKLSKKKVPKTIKKKDGSAKRCRRRTPDPVIIVKNVFRRVGFFVDKDGMLKCHCDNKDKGKMDATGLKKHLSQLKHVFWQEKRTEEQHRQEIIQEVVADKNQENLFRDSSVSKNDKAFRLRYIQMLIACGLPILKNNGVLHRFIQYISDQPFPICLTSRRTTWTRF